MDSPCLTDAETLSRFLDAELPPSEYRSVGAHVASCAACTLRVGRFRLADAALHEAQVSMGPKRGMGRIAASLPLAAALLASLATNVLLTPRDRSVMPQGPRLSAAPSETLSSFYEKVAPLSGRAEVIPRRSFR